MRYKLKLAMTGASVCLAASVPSVVRAAEGGSVLEEVVVSATKRNETIQDIPLSVTALSAESLARAGVSTFGDYAQKVPNLTYASGVGIIGRRIALRGIYGPSTTGFYIDEMPVSPTVDPRVIDLERVEVLRGPQGTLYGARSMGGTIRLITTAPNLREVESKVRASGSSVDNGGEGYELSGMTNLPLESARAAVRMSAYGGREGSFIARRYPSADDPDSFETTDDGQEDYWGAYISTLWQPIDKLTVRASVLTQKSKLSGWPLADVDADSLSQTRTFNIEELARDEWTYGGVTLNYETAYGDMTSSSSWFSRRTVEDEEFSDYFPFAFGTPPVPTVSRIWAPEHSFTQELRFASRLGGRVEFVAGVFYTRTTGGFTQLINPPGFDEATGGAFGTDLIFWEHSLDSTKEAASFGELTFKLTDQWSTILGLRYSRVETMSSDKYDGFAAEGQPDLSADFEESSTTPKIVVQYEPSADLNVYALAAQGFRPGFSQSPPPVSVCGQNYIDRGVSPDDLRTVDADSLWNYEIGLKTRLPNHALTFNTAVFWIEWDDIQQSSRFDCGYNFSVNVGAARSRGVEVEVTAAPLDGLDISLGVGYTDAVITRSEPDSPIQVGDKVQQIAPWTASVSVDYSFPLSASLNGYARADTSYTDRSFSATNDPVNPRVREDYTLLNLRGGISAGAWDLSLFVDNATNTHANLGDNGSGAAELPGRPRILVNRPRTYGIEASYKW